MTLLNTIASGLDSAQAQLAISASNLANAQTSGPLTPTDWGPATRTSPSASSSASPQAYQPLQATQVSTPGGGVTNSFSPVSPATQPAYQPDSPVADAQGLVAQPNVDPVKEVINQISASQSYRADLATLRVYEDTQKTLLAIA
jgi:flagellar basal-body rod protein FlgC